MVSYSRRALLHTSAGLACGSLAGCVGSFERSPRPECETGSLMTGEGAASGDGYWTQYAADAGNTGTTTDSGPDTGTLAWRYATCDSLGTKSAAVADGTVYITLGGNPGTLALDAATGAELWTAEIPGHASAPAYADGSLYVAGRKLRAVDATDGSVEWTFTRPNRMTPEGDTEPDSPGPIRGAPTVVDETIYLTGGIGVPWLYALDATDGTVRWRRRFPGPVLVSFPAVGPQRVYITDHKGRLIALDRTDGTIRWTRDFFNEDPGRMPVCAGNQVYVGTSRALHAFTLAGDQLWELAPRDGAGPCAVDGQRAYVPSDDDLIAVDVTTGERLWTHTVERARLGTPVVAADTVYIGGLTNAVEDSDSPDFRGQLFAVDRSTGDRQWAFTTRSFPPTEGGPNAGTFSSLAIGKGTVFAGTVPGDLYALADA